MLPNKMRYVTVEPNSKRHTIKIARANIGEEHSRYIVIAECRSDIVARQIVDALNKHVTPAE